MLEPAQTIIEYLGGPKDVAEILGKHISRVYRWTYPEDRGGTGGLIPSREQQKLMAHSHANDLGLKPEDFFSSARLRALIEERNRTPEAAE